MKSDSILQQALARVIAQVRDLSPEERKSQLQASEGSAFACAINSIMSVYSIGPNRQTFELSVITKKQNHFPEAPIKLKNNNPSSIDHPSVGRNYLMAA